MPELAPRLKIVNRSLGRTHNECPICGSPDLEYESIIEGYPACSCRKCSLLFLNPQPPKDSDDSLAFLDTSLYGVNSANATERLDLLFDYGVPEKSRVLLLGGDSALEVESVRRGLQTINMSMADLEFGGADDPSLGKFDGVICRGLETCVDPSAVLASIRRLLKADGALMVIAPTLDSRTARLFRAYWWEFNRKNRFYFSTDTLQCLLARAGFGDPIVAQDSSVVSLHYLRKRLGDIRAFPHRVLNVLLGISPPVVRHWAFRFLNSRTTILVRSKPLVVSPRLSVVVPVYNEQATFVNLIEQLLDKKIDGVDIEIIIVESNSQDGTREQVLRYKGHPRVQVILEDRPQGKGRAVRRGFEVATGDMVLIQDADLEYDINDYDSLVEPLIRYEQNFVIGSRHTSKGRILKMREFNDAAGMAMFFNFGHLVFLTLFNFIYWQRLKDPFSMFKVFRRQCLYGLEFECNRFDFDFELAIKLLRKGYRPVELPVNYRARSFSQGKKVSTFRDPLTWMRALVKFRTSPLYPFMNR